MNATVILVHQASSSPSEETMFFMVLRLSTPKNVPMMFPTPPVSIVPPTMEDAMAFISAPSACEGEPEPTCIKYT